MLRLNTTFQHILFLFPPSPLFSPRPPAVARSRTSGAYLSISFPLFSEHVTSLDNPQIHRSQGCGCGVILPVSGSDSPSVSSDSLRTISVPQSSNPTSGGVLAAAIVPPVIAVVCLLVVLTVLWRRRAERRFIAEQASTNAQQPVTAIAPALFPAGALASPAPRPISPSLPPPPLPSKSPQPVAPAEPARRPSFPERFRSSFPGLAARLSGSSRGSGRSRVDPVLPRTYTQRRVLFNSNDMLAPRRPRPRSAQQLGPPPAPPPTQPLPPTPTSAAVAAGGVPIPRPILVVPVPAPAPVPVPVKQEHERERERERPNGKTRRKVRPLPPLPKPKTPPPVVLPIVLRPNRLGEPLLPPLRIQHHQPRKQEQEQVEHQQEAVLVLAPRRWVIGRGSDGSSDSMPPPYATHPYAVARSSA
ncbi:hypothetical protein V8E53_004581 [Lactarius tabidus]